ncbi:methyltransferase type 11 [[Synechococcus] sp. NIES-970]|uniref:class I SAM-dependent methyltransferase n=1 Tax=Picosynechococcus sp. NKBG15041c TaxID=1407650 RepID=UPI0004643F38|nr:class I SAM-dependent methyltransferase [Picosynechococcus sp. NKBG15041c]BAW95469.1 methyltransferase type 11 [[Synechococcus] sp. NIES-970]
MTENVVQEYGWSTAQGPHSCDYIAPEVLKILENLKGKRILDLGAGNGALCSLLASSGYDVVGVEYDMQGVEIAKKTYPSIPFYKFGVQDNPADLLKYEEPFDVVVSTEVIEHLFSPHLLPRFAADVLKEGGHIILSTPYHGYLKNFALSLLNAWDKHHTPLWHGGHIKFWSKYTLSQLLIKNGFTVVGFSGVGRLPYLWKSMILIGKKVA